MTLRNNDTQTAYLRKKTIQRFGFILNLFNKRDGANAIIAADPKTVNLELIDIKCVLSRLGQEHILFHENLQDLAQESMFFKGYEHAFLKSVIELADDYDQLPLLIDLGSPVNLKGDDEIRLEVSSKPGWMGDYDANKSSLEVEDREAIGVEEVIPFIQTRPIQATLSRDKFSLGDNVTSIMLMCTEHNRTNSEADRIFDSIIINSDKVNYNDNRGRLLARRAAMFETVAAAAARGENFRYVPSVELDGVDVTLQLNGPNVASSKNKIVYRHFLITAEVTERANATKAKHYVENVSKLNAAS